MVFNMTTGDNASKGAVKSIQRGIAMGGSDSGANITIAINQVNPDKCIVLLDGQYYRANEMYMPTLVSLTATQMVVTPCGFLNSTLTYISSAISWQVIEFY